jgi:hypothetical protein
VSLAGRTGDSSAVSEHRAASLPVLCFLPHLLTRPYWRDVLAPGYSAEQKRAPSHWSATDWWWTWWWMYGWSSLQYQSTTHRDRPLLVHLACPLATDTPRPMRLRSLPCLPLPLALRAHAAETAADQVFAGPICGQQTVFGLMPAAASAPAKLSLHAGSCTCLERDQACILAASMAHD